MRHCLRKERFSQTGSRQPRRVVIQLIYMLNTGILDIKTASNVSSENTLQITAFSYVNIRKELK